MIDIEEFKNQLQTIKIYIDELNILLYLNNNESRKEINKLQIQIINEYLHCYIRYGIFDKSIQCLINSIHYNYFDTNEHINSDDFLNYLYHLLDTE